MKESKLNEILKYIVEDFIETATPVGSETLLSKHDLKCSSATIRNYMVELENRGLIEKTHASSGRVPSKEGYNFYVSHLHKCEEEKCVSEFENKLKLVLKSKTKSIEEVMDTSCKLLSDVTNMATVCLGPRANEEKLVSLQMIPISQNSVTVILVTDQGYVENKTFVIHQDTNVCNIEKCVSLLSQRLIGTKIIDLEDKTKIIGPLITEKLGKEVANVVEAFKQAVLNFAQQRVSTFGQRKLLDLPEFKDNREEYKNIIDYLNDTEQVINNIEQATQKDGIKFNIIDDLENDREIAIVSKDIPLNGSNKRQIAVVGPKRMDYSKVINALDLITKFISEYFLDSTEGEDNEEK